MSYFAEITPQEAADKIVTNTSALILDARDAHSYKESHIEGAMQAHGGLVEHLIGQQEYDRPVLVYCYHGISSRDLAEVFGRAGFKNCYSIKGGYTAWKKRDRLYASEPYSDQTNTWLTLEGFEKQSLNTVIVGNVTPLILACQQGKSAVVAELLAAGADMAMVDSNGNGAVWAACYSESIECLQQLVDAGAPLNQQNPDGVTALMYAASAGKTSAVTFLVEKGADVHLKNHDDFTALDLAANEAILKYLKPLYR